MKASEQRVRYHFAYMGTGSILRAKGIKQFIEKVGLS